MGDIETFFVVFTVWIYLKKIPLCYSTQVFKMLYYLYYRLVAYIEVNVSRKTLTGTQNFK